MSKQKEKSLAVALSGGGHRACLFGLGALMYLVDAGKGPSLASIASVSGGSLANGAVAQSLDLTAARPGDLDGVAARVAGRITGRGTLFGSRVTHAYVAGTALVALLVLGGPWLLPLAAPLKALALALGLLLVAWLASFRGRVCALAFDRTLFRPQGHSTRLASIRDGLDHVFCATDLHAGEHVYFSGRFVCSYRFGNGVPGDVRLSTVVQASAAFPGAFPVAWLPVSRHRFQGGAQPEAAKARKLALVDGGVYDNMADQWSQGLASRNARGAQPPTRFRKADQLVVVNSSAGLDWSPLRGLGLPLAGELLALLRDKSVLYDNGNSLRRQALIARFSQAEKDGVGIEGALVHIPQSPFKVPSTFQAAEGPRGARAQAALRLLTKDGEAAATEARWSKVAKENSAVPTTLVSFDVPTAARLLHHAYVLAMVNLHVVLGHPLLDMPDEARFERIARGEVG
jgi:hypothetical protein